LISKGVAVDEKELNSGFAILNQLAKSEYHRSIQDLMADSPSAFDKSAQIGRLIGVVLKEPFANPVRLEQPSSFTGAYNAWELDEGKFAEASRSAPWQYGVLEQLAETEGFHDAHNLAVEAHHERGFFGFLARSVAKYICGDPRIRRDIKKAADDARKSGINLTVTSPEVVVGSAGLSLGVLLVQNVPILGIVGAPVIAGFVLILYRIGVDAFCDWTRGTETPMERQ
jgi:hypothetical protein